MSNPLSRYLSESLSELRKVSWPSRETAVNHTVVVIVISLAFAVAIGVLDYAFAKLFEFFIK
ncbi:MAG: preprotein translocase subunit SecE [Parcubacteria group bacterium]|nr:preprotein translocase subunit SecE [Parcubacteria group bacterium]